MKPKSILRHLLAALVAVMELASVAHADQIWDGGSTGPGDDNWNTAANWGADTLPNFASAITFTGNTRNSAINDLDADTTIGGISLTNDNSAGLTNAFTLSGNRITLGSSNITTTATTTGTITDTISLNMILGATRTVTTNAGHNLSISGIISGTGGLTKSGTGTLTLSGNNSYTGGTAIGGTLEVTKLADGESNSSIGASTNAASNFVFGHNSTLRYTGSGDDTNRGITFGNQGGTLNFTVDASGTGALKFTNTDSLVWGTGSGNNGARNLFLRGTNTGDNTLAAAIGDNTIGTGGAASITKDGIGTWVISGNNTFTGATTARGGGTLVLDYSSQNNSKLSDTAALTLGGTSGGGSTITLKGGNHTEVVLSTTLATSGASFITRPDGDTGTSKLQMNAITRNRGANISFLDGTVATTDTLNTNGILGGFATIGDDWAVSAASGTDIAITALAAGSYTGALPSSGTGSSSANYTLSGAQSQTGASSLAANTVRIAGTGETDNTLDLAGSRITISGNTAATSGGILYIGGGTGIYNITSTSAGGIGVGTVNRDLIITTVRDTLNVSARIGAVQVGAGLVKAGAGTLVLSSPDNAYSQAVYVNEGVLRIASNVGLGAVSTGTSGTFVNNGAALELSNNISVGAEALTVYGTGVSNGGALRNHSGSNSYAGAITIGAGGAHINSNVSSSLALTGGIVTAANQDVTFGGAGTTTVSTTAISGAGGLIKDGAGTLTLGAANTYTGATTVNAGTLVVNGSTSASSVVTVTANATLSGTGTINGNAVIDGTHSPGNSPGIQPFGGNLTYGSGGETPSVIWDLVSNTFALADRGTNFDGINVSGALTFADPTTITLVFDLTSPDSTVDWNDAFWTSSYTETNGWLLYSGATSLSGFDKLSISVENWSDGSSEPVAFNSVFMGGFSLYQSGNDIFLNYNFVAVPEPSTLILAGLGLAGLTLRRRRRS